MGVQDALAGLSSGLIQQDRLLKMDSSLGRTTLVPLRAVGQSCVGKQFDFTVDLLSTTDNIELKSLIAQSVTLWIQQADKTYLPHHGYVHTARRLGADGALTYYQIAFASWLNFLRYRKDARIWQEKTADQILTDVFNMHPQARGAFKFSLKGALPNRSFCVQYEYDWDFCQRLMEVEGLYSYFEQASDGKSHTLVITDNLDQFPALAPQQLAFYRAGLNSEVNALTQWSRTRTLQSTLLTTRTFDYKSPGSTFAPKGTSIPTLPNQGDLPTQAEVYEYTGAYTYGGQKQGERLSKIRMEEWESRSKRFYGVGGVRAIDAGTWFDLNEHPEYGVGSSSQDTQFAVLAVQWAIENNLSAAASNIDFPYSLKAALAQTRETAATASAAASALTAAIPRAMGLVGKGASDSEGFYQVTLEAQQKNQPYRSPFEHAKPQMSLQTATVVGPNGQEVYTDALNRIKVHLHWDRLNTGDEKASCWIRVVQSDSGGSYGGVHAPRIGEEVLIDWLDGDCDRPIVVGRLYNGATSPNWHSNGLLSGYKSKEYQGSGYNQLVMDDATGQNRTQLYSSSTDAHLHLGYLIDHTDNTRGSYLGSGFDLKSTAYGALRAGQGLYVSTHPTDSAQPMNVQGAQAQLSAAQSTVSAMSDAAAAHQAESLADANGAIKAFNDATQHSVAGVSSGGITAGGGMGSANQFKAPVILMASPSGIGLSTQKSINLAADQQLTAVSGQSVHIAAGKSLLASVTEKISLFVQNSGMKLFAAKGKVEIQAQTDNIELTAQKAINVISATDAIDVVAKEEILLTSGGAYIRIKGGNIEIHAPGAVDIKGGVHAFSGPTRLSMDPPPLPTGEGPYNEQFKVHDQNTGEALSYVQYRIETVEGQSYDGMTDADGLTERIMTSQPNNLKIYLEG